MSMIERVARAIYEADGRSGGWSEWDDVNEAHPGNKALKDRYRKQARDAIEELREPTEAMMLAGWTQQFMNVGATLDEAVELANGKLDREEDVRFLKEGWSSAIDAALNEQVTG